MNIAAHSQPQSNRVLEPTAAVPAAATNSASEPPSGTLAAKVMIVDDEPLNVKVTQKYLQRAGYENFVTTSDARCVFDLVSREVPDLLLLDVVMPGVSGLDILGGLRTAPATSKTPIIILTASTDPQTKTKALELGASDFLAKPVDPSELVLRVRNVLMVKAHQDHLEKYAVRLEEQVRLRTRELAISRREVVECLARAAEYRDENTGHHIVRVGKIAALTARALNLPTRLCELIEQAAQLHDVGKIAVPDYILRKPGKLTPEEYDLMKQHCVLGQKILQRMTDEEFAMLQQNPATTRQMLSSRSSELIRLAARIALTHHEWWDGNGYPNGLAGNEIPIEGRITAVADVYDALNSKRPYKPAFPRSVCLSILKEQAGTQFDPRIVRAFFKVIPTIERVRQQLADSDS